MSIEAWRIVPELWATEAFNGKGAFAYGGRWNHPGRHVVYVAGTRALAALETLVHADRPSLEMLFRRFPVSFKEEHVNRCLTGNNWQSYFDLEDISSPDVRPKTQSYGDSWLELLTSPILEVPSAIIPEEPNYLLNPFHPAFKEIEIGRGEEFAFDPRLLF